MAACEQTQKGIACEPGQTQLSLLCKRLFCAQLSEVQFCRHHSLTEMPSVGTGPFTTFQPCSNSVPASDSLLFGNFETDPPGEADLLRIEQCVIQLKRTES